MIRRFGGPGMHGVGGIPLSSMGGGIGQDAASWTPADLTNIVWRVQGGVQNYQDAAETVPAVNIGDPLGGVVDTISGWDIKQTTAGKRPTLQQINNGGKTFWAMRFDGTDDFLLSASCGAFRNVSGGTMVVICQTADMAGAHVQLVVNKNLTPATARGVLVREASLDRSIGGGGRRLDGDGYASAESLANTFNAGQWGTQVGLYDWAHATLTVRYGGVQVAVINPFQTAGNTSDTDSLMIALGAQPNGALPTQGDIAEAFLVHDLLTADELTNLETYANDTYGI